VFVHRVAGFLGITRPNCLVDAPVKICRFPQIAVGRLLRRFAAPILAETEASPTALVLVFIITMTYFWQGIFPSLQRRGGRDIKKMARSLLRWSGRGGRFRGDI
jgi:hypothetical protein